jgi:hypothetical protein
MCRNAVKFSRPTSLEHPVYPELPGAVPETVNNDQNTGESFPAPKYVDTEPSNAHILIMKLDCREMRCLL